MKNKANSDINEFYLGCANSLQPTDKRLAKFREQRNKQFGFDDTETWNLNYAISKFMVIRLKKFKELSIAYPATLTPDEWNQILDEMILGFELFLTFDDLTLSEQKKAVKKINKSLGLFKKYFWDLWW